ncbi:MAG: ribokinase [Candidatus Humimicrobiaceae bacterium]
MNIKDIMIKNDDPIIVIGSSNYDIVLKTKKIPVAGETVMAGGMLTGFGGKGSNQAMTISRIGGNVRLFTCLGDDVFGTLYMDYFKRSGLNLDYLKVIKNSNNGVAVVNVDSSGRNNIVVFPGANDFLKPELILENIEEIYKFPIIITQLEIPVSTVRVLAQHKPEKNILILNPSPVDLSVDYRDILEKVDILLPNEIELSHLSGKRTGSLQEVKMAADILLKSGVKNIVITMGDKGVMVKNNDLEVYVRAEKVEAVDTEGAGDVFTGAFTYFYARTYDILKSARFANKIAAISVTRYGAQNSIPTSNEISRTVKIFI